VKNNFYIKSARPENQVALTNTNTMHTEILFKTMSPDEHQRFIQEEKRRLAQMAPGAVAHLIGSTLFESVAHQLFLECDDPFGSEGKLTTDGHAVALKLMHSALDALSTDMDDWLTHRVVNAQMHEMEIPFA